MDRDHYKLFRRKSGMFYLEHIETRKQFSLQTKDPYLAKQLAHAKNETARVPQLNLQLAKVYMSAADPQSIKRT